MIVNVVIVTGRINVSFGFTNETDLYRTDTSHRSIVHVRGVFGRRKACFGSGISTIPFKL